MILHNGNKEIELLVDDNSYSYEAIKGEDTLTLYFSHPGYLEVPVGSWCDFYGKRYSLKKDSNFKKNGERNFEYTLILETSKADMQLWKVRNTVDNRIKFSYTAKPKEHLKLIVDNLNRRSIGWVIGECIEGTEKLINYNHTYALDAINQLAETYETEYQITETVIDGVHTRAIHLKKVEYNKENPLKLSYGKGNGFKVGVGRESGDIPPEIILVETTDKNIDYSKYGAKELLMPKSQKLVYEGRTYKTDETGTCVMRDGKSLTTAKEDSLDCTEIYPSREGVVSEVITVDSKDKFYDFKDKDIPEALDFSQCRIDGETATIIFQTGMLAGKEFDLEQTDKKLTGYVHSERRFKLVSQEIDGITMPDGRVWMPKVGDKYAVFGIQLPTAYICDNSTKTGASWDVFREAAKYLYEHEDKKFTFTGTLDGIWAKKRWLSVGGKIVLGGYVNFSDTQFHPEGSLIRMTGIKRYVNNPYSPEIELSNDPVGVSVSSDLNKIETNEVVVDDKHKQALQFTKRRFRDAQETMEMLAGSLLNFSGAINPITVATMQLLVGDESLQFRFVNSTSNPVSIKHNVTYNASTKVLNAPAGILQHMTLGIKETSPTHPASAYKYWNVSTYNSPSLVEPDKKYYLYAKCSKSAQSGTFLLSEVAIEMHQIDGYYHLLMGVLNGEYDGNRSYVSLYGFTEILPGQIKTEIIRSADGTTYFDLEHNEIAGRIKFLSGLLSGLIGIGNQDGINAGMCGEGTSGNDVRIWSGASGANRKDAPFRILHNGKMIGTDVDITGKVVATSGEFSGTLKGATGTFKSLNCVNDKGDIVGGISFGSDGKMWFSGDLYNQGYDYDKKRSFRFYTSEVWCRGSFGSWRRNTLVIRGSYGYYYVNGLNNETGEVYVSLASAQSSNNETYYTIPLYGTIGDASGFPVDLVIINVSGTYRYLLSGEQSQKVTVVNANDSNSEVYIYSNGNKVKWPGGTIADCRNIENFMHPSPASNLLGRGWIIGAFNDNNWS